MPVQQVLPNVQDQSGEIWGNAIANISQVLGQGVTQYAQDYEASKKLAGHNDRVYAQAVDTLSDIKNRNNISDDQYAKLLKQVTPQGDEADYEKRMGNVFSTLVYWDRSGAAQKSVPIPDLNVAPDVNVSLINQQVAKADEAKNISSVVGTPGTQPQTPAPGQMGPPAPQPQGPGPQTLQSLTAMSQAPSVLTETAGQDLTKPNTANMAPEMASLANGGGDWHPPMAAPAQPAAPQTLSSTAPEPTGLQQMLDNIPTDSGKQQLRGLAQQLGKGLTYTEFKKEYIDLLKTETAASVAEQKAAKAAKDAFKSKMLEQREVVGDNGQSRPTTLSDLENPNIQFGGKLPTESVNTNYTYTNKAPKPAPERSPAQYNEVYKEVEKKNADAVKNGETPTTGIPDIALSIMQSDPKITSDKARQVASQALPSYEVASSIFKEDIIPRDQLLKFVTAATMQGYDSNAIYKSLLNKFGDKLGAVR
jgi:hypothetical protein